MAAGCQGLDSHSGQIGAKVTLPCGAEYGYKINIPNHPGQADITGANKGDYGKAIYVDVSFFKHMSENFGGGDITKPQAGPD
ncbi:hypothetical protein PEBR_10697 [Penicillium brasilianum]|uniref:Uncharacterized protein n=1 Tax=Penicillium brasilianum TaxID=104259 RepID=A0A1S9RUD4_PENBI|nr:hypothetical protein PEBR_10697 [Penicillium brasilianum]